MLDSKGFDLWAENYDQSIADSKGYPFEGYYDVLDYVYNRVVGRAAGSRILDIGFGTGALTNRLYKDGAEIYGVDFSGSMIDIAKEKMPRGHFMKADFSKGLPDALSGKKFDFILSTYAIHHIDNLSKADLIIKLKGLLNNNGKIILADVAFKTVPDFEKCRRENIDSWDNDEIYMVFEEFETLLKNKGLIYTYSQISSCAGVLIVQ